VCGERRIELLGEEFVHLLRRSAHEPGRIGQAREQRVHGGEARIGRDPLQQVVGGALGADAPRGRSVGLGSVQLRDAGVTTGSRNV